MKDLRRKMKNRVIIFKARAITAIILSGDHTSKSIERNEFLNVHKWIWNTGIRNFHRILILASLQAFPTLQRKQDDDEQLGKQHEQYEHLIALRMDFFKFNPYLKRRFHYICLYLPENID